ncbi:hypothetical protein MPSEU_000527400 [Mayamaea pseudoterrestris]|nr:hypothetical protein MPSEU_000527400 [Mayamaea pseudoterrestris]
MLWITSPLQASPLVGECLNTNAINQEPITDLRETVQRATTQEEEDPTANYTVNDLWTYYFQCDDIFEDERPVHNESMWMLLRGVYQGIVGPAKASIAQPLSTVSGFYIDYDVDQTDDKGRGVFADQDIRKGQLVYTARRQMAKFSNGYEYRRFLRSIPADLACDVIQWAYVENLTKDNLTICCDLDEGSIINDGEK